MAVPVYKRILDLFEAEGVNTLFGIPDPNFVHMFLEAESRGWPVVSPHHEESAGFMAEAVSRMTGKPGLCIGTLGPGVANIAGAMMCAKVENSPVIFLGGQRARITERRVRRGRIQFVRQEALFAPAVKYSASIEYADQTDEIVREAIRRAMSTTPGPAYIEYPSHVILEELDVADPLPPSAYRLVNHGAGAREIAEAAKLMREAKNPILLVGHGVHTSRTAAAVRELAELMACPVIQTSGGTSFIPGLEDRTFPYGFSSAAVEAVVTSDLCIALGTELGEPVHYGKTRHWAQNERHPQVDLRRAGPDGDRREPAGRRGAGGRPARRGAPAGRRAEGQPAFAVGRPCALDQTGCRPACRIGRDRAQPAGPRSTRRALWSRRPKRFRPRASWSATAARRSSFSGPIRRPSRTTSSGTRTSATSARACPMPSALRSPTAASGRSCC